MKPTKHKPLEAEPTLPDVPVPAPEPPPTVSHRVPVRAKAPVEKHVDASDYTAEQSLKIEFSLVEGCAAKPFDVADLDPPSFVGCGPHTAWIVGDKLSGFRARFAGRLVTARVLHVIDRHAQR